MTFCETSMLSCFVSDRFFSEGERCVASGWYFNADYELKASDPLSTKQLWLWLILFTILFMCQWMVNYVFPILSITTWEWEGRGLLAPSYGKANPMNCPSQTPRPTTLTWFAPGLSAKEKFKPDINLTVSELFFRSMMQPSTFGRWWWVAPSAGRCGTQKALGCDPRSWSRSFGWGKSMV